MVDGAVVYIGVDGGSIRTTTLKLAIREQRVVVIGQVGSPCRLQLIRRGFVFGSALLVSPLPLHLLAVRWPLA